MLPGELDSVPGAVPVAVLEPMEMERVAGGLVSCRFRCSGSCGSGGNCGTGGSYETGERHSAATLPRSGEGQACRARVDDLG